MSINLSKKKPYVIASVGLIIVLAIILHFSLTNNKQNSRSSIARLQESYNKSTEQTASGKYKEAAKTMQDLYEGTSNHSEKASYASTIARNYYYAGDKTSGEKWIQKAIIEYLAAGNKTEADGLLQEKTILSSGLR